MVRVALFCLLLSGAALADDVIPLMTVKDYIPRAKEATVLSTEERAQLAWLRAHNPEARTFKANLAAMDGALVSVALEGKTYRYVHVRTTETYYAGRALPDKATPGSQYARFDLVREPGAITGRLTRADGKVYTISTIGRFQVIAP